VDAFNLALETVLDEEAHLFDEAEMEVFRKWRELDYESQYLCVVRLIRICIHANRLDTCVYSFARPLPGIESTG
jgi:Fanconi-associated nuclease 1